MQDVASKDSPLWLSYWILRVAGEQRAELDEEDDVTSVSRKRPAEEQEVRSAEDVVQRLSPQRPKTKRRIAPVLDFPSTSEEEEEEEELQRASQQQEDEQLVREPAAAKPASYLLCLRDGSDDYILSVYGLDEQRGATLRVQMPDGTTRKAYRARFDINDALVDSLIENEQECDRTLDMPFVRDNSRDLMQKTKNMLGAESQNGDLYVQYSPNKRYAIAYVLQYAVGSKLKNKRTIVTFTLNEKQEPLEPYEAQRVTRYNWDVGSTSFVQLNNYGMVVVSNGKDIVYYSANRNKTGKIRDVRKLHQHKDEVVAAFLSPFDERGFVSVYNQTRNMFYQYVLEAGNENEEPTQEVFSTDQWRVQGELLNISRDGNVLSILSRDRDDGDLHLYVVAIGAGESAFAEIALKRRNGDEVFINAEENKAGQLYMNSRYIYVHNVRDKLFIVEYSKPEDVRAAKRKADDASSDAQRRKFARFNARLLNAGVNLPTRYTDDDLQQLRDLDNAIAEAITNIYKGETKKEKLLSVRILDFDQDIKPRIRNYTNNHRRFVESSWHALQDERFLNKLIDEKHYALHALLAYTWLSDVREEIQNSETGRSTSEKELGKDYLLRWFTRMLRTGWPMEALSVIAPFFQDALDNQRKIQILKEKESNINKVLTLGVLATDSEKDYNDESVRNYTENRISATTSAGVYDDMRYWLPGGVFSSDMATKLCKARRAGKAFSMQFTRLQQLVDEANSEYLL